MKKEMNGLYLGMDETVCDKRGLFYILFIRKFSSKIHDENVIFSKRKVIRCQTKWMADAQLKRELYIHTNKSQYKEVETKNVRVVRIKKKVGQWKLLSRPILSLFFIDNNRAVSILTCCQLRVTAKICAGDVVHNRLW